MGPSGWRISRRRESSVIPRALRRASRGVARALYLSHSGERRPSKRLMMIPISAAGCCITRMCALQHTAVADGLADPDQPMGLIAWRIEQALCCARRAYVRWDARPVMALTCAVGCCIAIGVIAEHAAAATLSALTRSDFGRHSLRRPRKRPVGPVRRWRVVAADDERDGCCCCCVVDERAADAVIDGPTAKPLTSRLLRLLPRRCRARR
jgi:hypothetical protein